MNRPAGSRRHQQGAVAIIVAIVIGLLLVMVGLVVDLGYLYTRKTELQNAADAAALAGAKELDGTRDGIDAAVRAAKDMAALNNVNFGNEPIADANALTDANIWFANTPDGNDTNNDGKADADWSTPTEARDAPANKRFIKVDTTGIGLSTVQTWFMRVAGTDFEETSTYGRAVAGPYTIDVAPIGVCAIDKERHEYGFIRGVSYNIPQLNPLIIPPDPLWINPINAPPDACDIVDPQWNSRDKMAAFVCTGKSLSVREVPGEVFVNTGATAALEKELNSRFDDYQGSKCNVATAPPDNNIRQYPYNGLPRDWMEPTGSTFPTQQGITIIDRKPVDMTLDKDVADARSKPSAVLPGQYGVLWSHAWERNFATGEDHALADWPSLYGLSADQDEYPDTGTPYSQASGSKYFQAPGNPGTAGRRMLNLVIIDCSDPDVNQVGPGNKCAALPTLAVGKFFMPVPANLPNYLYLEFGGLTSPSALPSEIRLYQ